MKNFSLILVLFLAILACDPCAECDTTTSFEPTVEMVFINQDSINSINNAIIAFNAIDSSLNANIDSLTNLRDSLDIVEDSIANGGVLDVEKQNLEDWIMDRQEDSTFFANENVGLDSVEQVLRDVRTDISSGLLLVSEISLPEVGQTLTYSDSSTSWNFPISYEEEFFLYELLINEEEFSIEIDYETFTEVDEERFVLIRARDIEIVNHTFDDLDSCDVNCVDGEATFIFYF